MEFSEYKETVIDKTPESKGLLYCLAALWLHPECLPLMAIHLGNCTDKIIRIPNWSGEDKVVLFASGPAALHGPSTPVITFTEDVFHGNTHVTDVILQSNIKRIPAGAFAKCTALERITIPKSVKRIRQGTFEGCDKLKDVYYAGSEEDWKKVYIVHKGAKVRDGSKLGLHAEIEHYDIPGNEPLLNASIHFNCDPDAESCDGLRLSAGGRDITMLFTVR